MAPISKRPHSGHYGWATRVLAKAGKVIDRAERSTGAALAFSQFNNAEPAVVRSTDPETPVYLVLMPLKTEPALKPSWLEFEPPQSKAA